MKGIYFWRDLPRLSSRGLDPPLCSMQLIFFVVMALVYDNKYENSSHFFRRKCAKLPAHAHSKLLSKWFPNARCNLRLVSTRPYAILCLVYVIRTYSFFFLQKHQVTKYFLAKQTKNFFRILTIKALVWSEITDSF